MSLKSTEFYNFYAFFGARRRALQRGRQLLAALSEGPAETLRPHIVLNREVLQSSADTPGIQHF